MTEVDTTQTSSSPMVFAIISVVTLGFAIDAAAGRLMLLRVLVTVFIEKGPLASFGIGTLFTVMLLLSSGLFIAIWLLIENTFNLDIRYYLGIGLIFYTVFVITLIISVLSSNVIFWLFTAPWVFNLLSFLLFSLGTISLSRGAMIQKRGRAMSVGVFMAMAIALICVGISQFIADLTVLIFVIALTILILATPALINLVFAWDNLINQGIKSLEKSERSSYEILKNNSHILFAILSGSLFLMGSGIAHQFLVSTKSAILAISPIYGFIASIILIAIVSPLSDKYGRYIILVGAIISNSISQILSILNLGPVVISALEIAGYYAALVFIMLKTADHITPRVQKFAGVAWGLIFIADFTGFLLAEFIVTLVPQIVLFFLSLVFMIASLFFVFLIPNLTSDDAELEVVSILSNDDGRIIYTSGDYQLPEGKKQQLLSFEQEKEELQNEHVEFDDGTRAIVSRSAVITTAVFVNLHSRQLEDKVIELSSEIDQSLQQQEQEQGELKHQLDQVIDQYITRTPDPEGTDVQFAL